MARRPSDENIKDSVCNYIFSGRTLTEWCNDNAKYGIDENKVYQWRQSDEEFKKKWEDALQIFYLRKVEELEVLSKTDLDPSMPASDLRTAQKQRDTRITALKFLIQSVAPKFTQEFKETKKEKEPKQNTEQAITIQVVSYAESNQRESSDQVNK
jgi:hypothetical protein